MLIRTVAWENALILVPRGAMINHFVSGSGSQAVGDWAVGRCMQRSAHWDQVWLTSRHRGQNVAPWPSPRPSIVDACNPGRSVFHLKDGSTVVCWQNARS